MQDKQRLNHNRVTSFNHRAKYHLKSDLGFNLKRPEESLDFARSILTECADQSETIRTEDGTITFAHDADRERMAIAVGFLEFDPNDSRESIDILETRLREMVEQGHVSKKQKYLQEFTLSIAGFAARSLIERFPALTEEKTELTAVKPKNISKPEYVVPAEPDYANLQDVIRYLYQAGNISPSHAAALFVTLGYVRPETGINEELKNDILRIRADLRSRLEVYRKQKPGRDEQSGLRIIEAFIACSVDNPSLQLNLDDADAMEAVGKVMVKLHKLQDVRPKAPTERANKYDGMGTKITFEE